ncbi:von Willebrand factor type A domain protein [Roseimaritima ulvae]|uniref:von Willebrand factor type A domain protein n=2 Tax=Roseimaritima ulvae TaxID=980254 RepID=A0A5B9QXE6_9BACT|nr:von Willebrand factor type A domain protein [Roseimaritima ulvae]
MCPPKTLQSEEALQWGRLQALCWTLFSSREIMFNFRLGFEHPVYLWLLLILPLLWWVSFRSLASLGQLRRALALLLRTTVLTGFILALAGVQLVWTSDRMTVMYLLDQSESIPEAKRQLMLDYVIRNVRRHRDAARQDRAGIIVFGREATIEIPPFDDNIPQIRRLESYIGRKDATSLESALVLAQAAMPDDTSRRLVIVTDGNENLGNAQKLASRLADSGIGIDVVPVILESRAEVLVEKVDLPADIRKGQPFEARVVVNSYTDDEDATPVSGRLQVTRINSEASESSAQEDLLVDSPMTLEPGKNVFAFPHQIDRPAPYTFRARFVPDEAGDDGLKENNEASAYTYIRGQGRVLMIEDFSNRGQYDLMAERLRAANIEVVVRPSDQLFGSLAELQAYDAAILAGVPRVSGSADDTIVTFDDDKVEMLVRNTQQLGCGLMMIGGPEALGAGGWTGTKLEEAMPVDFQVKNKKIEAVGALAMILHACEMAQGNYWQKVIAQSALEQLGPADEVGVLHWNMNGDSWLWGGRNGMLPVGPNKQAMLAAVRRMAPGDMPAFDNSMRMAATGLARTNASMKHCIIISDGDPSPPTPATIKAFKDNKITISTVTVAGHGSVESKRMRDIANQTGGKYYEVKNAKALPKIFQREARRVARPLVHEIPGGASPEVTYPHPALEGIDSVLPPITGFVLTQTKDSPLARVLIRSPSPPEEENSTVLAVWTYGLGRTAVLTTDTGARWAQSWTQWGDYDKFFSQLVRWLMRPTGDTGKFDLATQVRNGEVQVVVSALDKDDAFLNFLDMNASAVGPDLQDIPLQMQQTAPGRYVGSFPADQAGSYFVNIAPQAGMAPLTTGVTVPYSEEFRVRDTNNALLTTLVNTAPRGGEAGKLTPPLARQNMDEVVEENAFRKGLALARSIRDAWPWFVFVACCLFLGDVMVRRVAINMDWMTRWMRRSAKPENQTPSRLQALKERKEAVGESLDRRRAAVRFEPSPDVGSDGPAPELDPNAPSGKSPAKKKTSAASLAPEGDGKTYTERLLEAKRKARKNREEGE